MEAETMRSLITERGIIKGKLTRFYNFVKKSDESSNAELQFRLEGITKLVDKFEKVQSEIEHLNPAELESSERESFEDIYYAATGLAKQLITDNQQALTAETVTNLSQSNNNYTMPKINLPPMDLPTFNGDYSKWLTFYQRFNVMVDKNPSLSDVDKFYFLQGCLKGAAEQVLQDLDESEENYACAMQLLKQRYENKRVVIDKHLADLYNLPCVLKASHSQLRKLVDSVKTHLKSLKSLGEPVDCWDRLLIQCIKTKLDNQTRLKWQEMFIINKQKAEPPTFAEFMSFLVTRCEFLESTELNSIPTNSTSLNFRSLPNKNERVIAKDSNQKRPMVYLTTNKAYCAFCKKNDHYMNVCKTFIKLGVLARRKKVKELKLCFNCLKSNHIADTCTGGSCKVCQRKHNTVLHMDFDATSTRILHQNESDVIESSNTPINTDITDSPTVMSNQVINSTNVLLSTVELYVQDNKGNLIKARALLDSGSQSNFITTDFAKRLNLKCDHVDLPLIGINQSVAKIQRRTHTTIKSIHNAFQSNISCFVLHNITGNIPNFVCDKNLLRLPTNIKLADPDFDKSRNVDILLGAGIFWDAICVGQIKLGLNQPLLHKTQFGWIISGPISFEHIQHNNQISCNFVKSADVQNQLERFWQIEECPEANTHTSEDILCEDHFTDNFKRLESGRFEVRLPIRENSGELGNSLNTAVKRFNNLERKLSKNPDMRKLYSEFMSEYERLGHMSKLDENERNLLENNATYYLPHHGVYREDSLTTKLRVVFDASAKTSSGVSLNDKLMVGPVIQNDIFSILTRFRKHNFVLTADITKMYRQVQVTENQRDLQRIVWRSDPSEPLNHYKLNTVTYGTAPASFLAIRCINQLAIENERTFPLASEVILRDFYVDDLITGSDSISEAIQLKQDISQILSQGCFQLRKWKTNEPSIFENDAVEDDSTYYITSEDQTKTLGLWWNSKNDTLHYCIACNTDQRHITKRKILASIAQIFDPLGLVGPVVVKVKVMLQKLWQLKLEWDESVPINIFTEFCEFLNEISELTSLTIPRQVILPNAVKIEVHGFSDASEAAYGACLYLRSIDQFNNCEARLICAKSRVAPLKVISLPRLELAAALLLAKLMSKVLKCMKLDTENVCYYSDSMIVIAWLKLESRCLKTFVANRVAEIQRLTDINQWRHIRSSDNPADIISRGLAPSKLINSELWWRGPLFLRQTDFTTTVNDTETNYEVITDLPEIKKSITVSVANIDESLLNKYSSFNKLNKVVAYCFRFKGNCLSIKVERKCGQLSIEELNNALISILKLVQVNAFQDEIKCLQKNQLIPSKSKLLTLNPFMDQHGLIRVGGRISISQHSFDKKFPIVLPYNHHITKLLIQREHVKLLHAGNQATLSSLRNHYWPLNGKSVTRQVLRKCVRCFKIKPLNAEQIMGELPEARLTPIRPFTNCAIDYAGPFVVKDSLLRTKKTIKIYLCLFVCMVTKAVHLELATDLTTNAFLNALKRFVSRRGLCSNIYSDNGTNFIGADNEIKGILKNIHNDQNVSNFLMFNSIKWHFIPARSPHMGGLWEAAVKSTKYHLKRIVGNNLLNFEELNTICVQVEAVLNSRPLLPLTDDPNDLTPLTPSHFLIGDILTSLPQTDVQNQHSNKLSSYHKLQQVVQHFWKRWENEYISSIQQRTKWNRQHPQPVRVGDLVLLKEENTPPLCWPLGRVTELFPGKDNLVRVVAVKVKSSIVKRAICRICPLPIKLNE